MDSGTNVSATSAFFEGLAFGSSAAAFAVEVLLLDCEASRVGEVFSRASGERIRGVDVCRLSSVSEADVCPSDSRRRAAKNQNTHEMRQAQHKKLIRFTYR